MFLDPTRSVHHLSGWAHPVRGAHPAPRGPPRPRRPPRTGSRARPTAGFHQL